ncbi:MAG: stage V sporulation protein AD [Oscillospiraceae bacterium]|jgi:stage V sporulation protein AD|nr:stage V sporulation protein AD [Oscillospiraceae bacterium]
MKSKRVGAQTVRFDHPPSVVAGASVVGKKEGEGPLAGSFDIIENDSFMGEDTWERSESALQRLALDTALQKAGKERGDVDYVFAGDLLNQCTGASFGLRDTGIPFFGVYGACSTSAECLALAAMALDGEYAECAAAVTSSHFCAAERQFRFPLEYGGQRTPTAQWTVTGAGAFILLREGTGPYVTHATCGKITDMGVTDANNMGAAMAPAAHETLSAHFNDTRLGPGDYDLIVTGDLGLVGSAILVDLFLRDGIDIRDKHRDCGAMIFDPARQDVKSGGSGCGCSAAVLAGHLLDGVRAGTWNKILFAATGALLSVTSTQQRESIPGICHAVAISGDPA